MKINIHHIPAEGKRYEGEETASELKIDIPLFELKQPVRYELEASLTGKGLLVRGKLHTVVCATCVRTLEKFDLPVNIEEFTVHIPEIQGDIVDLTPYIREDILLELPAHPIGPEAAKTVYLTHEEPPARANAAWEKLEKIKAKLKSGK